MVNAQERLTDLRRRIASISPAEAVEAQRSGAVLVDVREAEEIDQGLPEGALPLGRGFLELRIGQEVPDTDRPVLLLCATGARSLFAAESLSQLGYRDVRNVEGGFQRWKAEGLPFVTPEAVDRDFRQRYARQMAIPEIGEAGQRRLAASRVLLVGAGGLGSPAALYLAAAGVGTLGLVDDDVVDRSNLHRQVLHPDSRVGMGKVASGQATLQALNPHLVFRGHPVRLAAENVDELVAGYDLVLDGSDNFATRYLLNDACLSHGLPLVHGAVYRFEGQVAAFWPARNGPCYRCIFPEPPPPELAPSCAEAGVLGVLPGIIGLLQATEALKLLLDLGTPLTGRLLAFDALRSELRNLRVAARDDCICRGTVPRQAEAASR